MADDLQQQYIQCLATADDLETYWHYYQQCRGHEFGKECHEAAIAFFKVFDSLPGVLRVQIDFETDKIFAHTPQFSKITEILRIWVEHSKGRLVIEEDINSFVEGLFISEFFRRLKSHLFKELGLARDTTIKIAERHKANTYLKWRGHLPELKIEAGFDPDALMHKAGNSPSIVIVGDIRRSQDLMTYAVTPIEFAGRINTFIAETRRLLDKHGGFFDKFTGDGFIAYFNNEISNWHVANRDESFLGFIREYQDFSVPYFQEWKRHLKKLPNVPIGLAIGADLGIVSFQNFNYHLVAVGEPIVWASRMAEVAKAGEIIINNLLYEELHKRDDVSFQEHQKETKSGEGFLAYSMSFSKQL